LRTKWHGLVSDAPSGRAKDCLIQEGEENGISAGSEMLSGLVPDSLDRRWMSAFDFGLYGKKLLAPGFAAALGALIHDVSHGVTVIALLASVAGKFLAFPAALDLSLHLRAAMLLIQHVFAGYAHGLLLTAKPYHGSPAQGQGMALHLVQHHTLNCGPGVNY